MEEGQRESLGAVVKTLREAQGLSREELVVRTHDDPEQRISLEMLAKVEQGRRAPSAKTLRKLAHALGLEPTTLVSSAALWEAGSADGTHVAALRSHVLGNASVGASLGTLGAGLGRFSQPTKYGVAAIAGGLVGMPVAAAGVAAVGGLRELQR
ncbi:MAG: family transcriptional regulator, partial [Alphaproteobacteria bacterium]|nr:family transcriptional regulator [Alphaproteobacteria bacterium]